MKKPWLSLLLSFILPGIGHMYLGKMKKGLLLLVLYVVSLFTTQFVVGIILLPLIWVYAMISSYKEAKELHNI